MKSGISKILVIFASMKELILFYIAFAGLLFLVHISPLGNLLHPDVTFIFAFLAFQSYLTFSIAQIGLKDGKEKFIQFQMINLTIRFVLSLSFIGFFAYSSTPEIFLFVINFFVLYLCSANFEIIGLLRNLRRF
jgi:hypothetical protein